jgi:hypothetical protein
MKLISQANAFENHRSSNTFYRYYIYTYLIYTYKIVGGRMKLISQVIACVRQSLFLLAMPANASNQTAYESLTEWKTDI